MSDKIDVLLARYTDVIKLIKLLEYQSLRKEHYSKVKQLFDELEQYGANKKLIQTARRLFIEYFNRDESYYKNTYELTKAIIDVLTLLLVNVAEIINKIAEKERKKVMYYYN